MDGTLIEAAAILKSFRPKDEPAPPTDDDPGNPLVDFRGERRRNETHASTTDPEARLLRKGPGKEAKMAFLGHALMENRHGLLMDFTVSLVTGTAERKAVPELRDWVRERGYRPRALGADRGYDTQDCVKDMRAQRVTPHVAQKKNSAINGLTTRPAGYAVSLRLRKRVEEVFGWMKTVGGLRRTRYRGVARTGLAGYLVTTSYNLVRMANLIPEPETAAVSSGRPLKGAQSLPGFLGVAGPTWGETAQGVSGPVRPPQHRFHRPRRGQCHSKPILQQPARQPCNRLACSRSFRHAPFRRNSLVRRRHR